MNPTLTPPMPINPLTRVNNRSGPNIKKNPQQLPIFIESIKAYEDLCANLTKSIPENNFKRKTYTKLNSCMIRWLKLTA